MCLYVLGACLCACTWAGMGQCTCICMCMHEEARGKLHMSSTITLYLSFFEMWSFIKPGAHQLSWPMSPSTGLQMCRLYLAFPRRRSCLRSSCLQNRHCTNQVVSSALKFEIYLAQSYSENFFIIYLEQFGLTLFLLYFYVSKKSRQYYFSLGNRLKLFL